MTTQLDLLTAVHDNPQPLADRYRQRIKAAFIAAAETSDDHATIDPNAVRALLSNEHGLTVPPRMLSAAYSVLRAEGVIEHVGWTTNTDHAGGNAGKPARLYRWIGGVA
jgi:hypothetical protein